MPPSFGTNNLPEADTYGEIAADQLARNYSSDAMNGLVGVRSCPFGAEFSETFNRGDRDALKTMHEDNAMMMAPNLL